jgi:hypothetical protein
MKLNLDMAISRLGSKSAQLTKKDCQIKAKTKKIAQYLGCIFQ